MIIFDLETIPREQLSEQLLLYRSENLPVKELKTGNLKDPLKIMAKKEEVERENAEIKQNFRMNDGVDVDYCQVIAAGILSPERPQLVEIITGNEDVLVSNLLSILSESKSPFIGFNIKGFDIPILKRLKMRYQCTIPLPFTKDNVVDLMDIFRFDYRTFPKKLIEYGMIYGAQVDLSIAEGSKIHEWYLDANTDAIYKHLTQDLKICQHLYHKLVSTNLIEGW
jgi:hypothetical protein